MISLIESVVKTVGKVIPDKDKQKEIELELTKAVNSGEIELEKIALQSKKIEADLRMEILHKIPNAGIWWVLLFAIIFNYILPPTISYVARLFMFDAVINQGKDITQIIQFFTPPQIELPAEYWTFMFGIYGVSMGKKSFNRWNDKK